MLGKWARLPLLRPPRMKKTWTQDWPAIWYSAMMSASVRLAGLMMPLPCTWVSARMRSRTAAAVSYSMRALAASISAESSRCRVATLPERNDLAWATRPA